MGNYFRLTKTKLFLFGRNDIRGDGRVNFAPPESSRTDASPVGSGHISGRGAVEQAHTLSISEIPTHTHVANGSSVQPMALQLHR